MFVNSIQNKKKNERTRMFYKYHFFCLFFWREEEIGYFWKCPKYINLLEYISTGKQDIFQHFSQTRIVEHRIVCFFYSYFTIAYWKLGNLMRITSIRTFCIVSGFNVSVNYTSELNTSMKTLYVFVSTLCNICNQNTEYKTYKVITNKAGIRRWILH